MDHYHVEPERHAVLLAEGLPVESYLDTGNRRFFTNANARLVPHPDRADVKRRVSTTLARPRIVR